MNPWPAHFWASSPLRFAIATTVTLSFAALARALRGVNLSGALAGGLACFLLFLGAGPAAFAVLAALFAVTWLSTRLGYSRKMALGLAERREGRSAGQVLANLAAASLGAVFYGATGDRAWLVAAVAALAEAAIDTVASEIGQIGRANARLITTWHRVSAGTDGGITGLGCIAGIAAGLLLAVLSVAAGLIPASQIWIAVSAGFFGMLFDSFLGATVQRRGWINNQTVNLIATVAAATVAYAVLLLV
jgi:uncharacterized protein (TIGR00297 family)